MVERHSEAAGGVKNAFMFALSKALPIPEPGRIPHQQIPGGAVFPGTFHSICNDPVRNPKNRIRLLAGIVMLVREYGMRM
jgi:hypothetical protein